MILLWIALGGALGSVARFSVVTLSDRILGTGLPSGTLIVNVVGSFAMGFLAAFLARKFAGAENLKYFLTTGFLGGFTTFSAFSLDVFQLMQRGEMPWALVYVAASVVLSIVALFAGYALAQGINT